MNLEAEVQSSAVFRQIKSYPVFLFLVLSLIFIVAGCKKNVIPASNTNLSIGFNGGRKDNNVKPPIRTKDGGYLVFGTTKSFGNGSDDVFLMKLNASHQEEWYKTYGGKLDDQVFTALQMPDGGYVVAGSSLINSIATKDTGIYGNVIFMIRTDKNGDSLWTKTYLHSINGVVYNDNPSSICFDGQGSIYIGSSSQNTKFQQFYSICILKINENGDQQSFIKLNSTSVTICSMLIDDVGNFVARTIGPNGLYILKFDTKGKLLKEKLIINGAVMFPNNLGKKWKMEGNNYVGTDVVSESIWANNTILAFKYAVYNYTISSDLSLVNFTLYDSFTQKPELYSPAKIICAEGFGNDLMAEAIPLTEYTTGLGQYQGQFSFQIRNSSRQLVLSKKFIGWPVSVISDEKGNFFIVGLSVRPLSNTRSVFTMYVDSKGEVIN